MATSQTPSFLRSSFMFNTKPEEPPFGIVRRGSLHERQPSVTRQPSVSRFQNLPKYNKPLDLDDDDVGSIAGSITSSRLGKYSASNNIG